MEQINFAYKAGRFAITRKGRVALLTGLAPRYLGYRHTVIALHISASYTDFISLTHLPDGRWGVDQNCDYDLVAIVDNDSVEVSQARAMFAMNGVDFDARIAELKVD